jgi:Flp pilus assembly pilin Flp
MLVRMAGKATAIEYGLIAALISIAIIVIVNAIGSSLLKPETKAPAKVETSK